MKRLMLFIVVCLLIIGGCAKHNSGGLGPILDPTPIPIPVPNPVPTAKSPLAPVSTSDMIEIVTFAVNQDFADKYPEWTNGAARIITDTNISLEKSGCEKRYMSQTTTYSDADALYGIKANPAYFADNNFVGKPIDSNTLPYGGLTIVYWVKQTVDSSLPQFFVDHGIGFTTPMIIGNKQYWATYIANDATTTPLLNGSSNESIYSNLSLLENVFGLTHGCGQPMWYRLVCFDNSGTVPNLAYNLPATFPKDPMGGWIGGEPIFSPLNAMLFDKNANRQLTGGQIENGARGLGIKVKVTKPSGYIVPNATVTVYCGVSATKYGGYGDTVNMESVLQTVTTDEYGEAIIRKPANPWDTFNAIPWLVAGIKVSSNGRTAGKAISIIDLEEWYLKNGPGTYVLTLVLPDVVTSVQ